MEHQNREISEENNPFTDRKNSEYGINKEEDGDVIINCPESTICPEKRHQCKECDKSFSSGKALGGHMSSAHVQASKDYSLKTGSSSPGPGPECPICGKQFLNQKSLYGHMRCHPDREWRGMEPPPTSPDDTLKGWAVKAIRGSGAQPNKTQDISSEDYEEGVRAGHELLRLLKRNLDSCGYENGHNNEVRYGNRDSTRQKIGKIKADILFNSAESENGTQENHTNQRFDFKKIPILDNVPIKPKPKQKDGLCDYYKYACSICSKVFSSHQALGGHKSSHNKFKINIVNAVDQVTTSQDKNACCEARNYNGEQKQAQLKCDDNGGNSKDKGKVVRGFDLNMMPDDEEVEDSSADKSEV
ncbi:zinc finger family protein [Striga asiatica]|uniref:Zinc finger family protein n=1 Tax=Striga asiatica TaxID=4170 RepID=A0A5A7RDT0_STRAF|nr:zinc finger family protein [Striga asiatica]